jgi:cell division septal protein FtsQ
MKGKTFRHVEQDRRYWRRRGNLKVRKARLTRKSFRWTGLLLFNSLLIWAGWTACSRTLDLACAAPEFQLANLAVEGVHQTPEAPLRSELQPFLRGSLLTLDLEEVAAAAERHPWVEQAAVKRVLPCGVRIRLKERVPAALFRSGDSIMVVDRTGFVFDTAGLKHPAELKGLPVLKGIEGAGEEEMARRIRLGLDALQSLQGSYPQWSTRLATLDMAKPDRITVTSGNSDVRLFLDPENVLMNFEHFLALREQIHNRIGPVDYFDLRWKDRIALMPGVS